MQISQIVPNIWNPPRVMAEIVKILELGTRLLSNPNKCGYWLFISIVRLLKMCAVGAFSASEMCFCTYCTYYAICMSICFEICILDVLFYEKECILTKICETVAEYHYLYLDLSSIW